MKTSILCAGLSLACIFFSFAQPVVLLEESGIKVSYELKKLEEDKKHDKWQISVSIENNNPQDLAFTGSATVNQYSHEIIAPNYFKIEIPNHKGLLSTGARDYQGEKTGLLTTDAQAVFRIPKGRKDDSFNTNVEKGVTPTITGKFLVGMKTLNDINILRVNTDETTAVSNRVFLVSTGGNGQREELSITYLDWNNQLTAATYNGAQFRVGLNKDFTNPQITQEINFLGWDKSRMSARITGDNFLIFRNGNMTQAQEVPQMNYLGGDGYNSSATLKKPARNMLMPGDLMLSLEYRTSINGKYRLTLQQDGNLVLTNVQHQAIWASGTNGKAIANCTMQTDGNLVLYFVVGGAAWASNTNGNQGIYLVVQNDGNLALFRSDGSGLWCTNTVGR